MKIFGVLRWLLIAASLLLWACASGHEAAYVDAPEPRRDLGALQKRIVALAAACPRLRVDVIGTVRYPGFEAPLECLRLYR